MAIIALVVLIALAVLNLVLTFLQFRENYRHPLSRFLSDIDQSLEELRRERMDDVNNKAIQEQLDRIEELLSKQGPIGGEYFRSVYFDQGLTLTTLLALSALIVYTEFIR